MGYNDLIKSSVEKAFTLLGDLAVDVTLVKASKNEYDFGSSSFSSETTSLVVKGVLLAKASIPNSEAGREGAVLVLKKSDVGDISSYNTFTISGKKYRFQNFADNGFTVEIEVSGG